MKLSDDWGSLTTPASWSPLSADSLSKGQTIVRLEERVGGGQFLRGEGLLAILLWPQMSPY